MTQCIKMIKNLVLKLLSLLSRAIIHIEDSLTKYEANPLREQEAIGLYYVCRICDERFDVSSGGIDWTHYCKQIAKNKA